MLTKIVHLKAANGLKLGHLDPEVGLKAPEINILSRAELKFELSGKVKFSCCHSTWAMENGSGVRSILAKPDFAFILLPWKEIFNHAQLQPGAAEF